MQNFYPLSEGSALKKRFKAIHDRARLTALESYPIFDTPEEQQLNDITKLAALICDTPVALINLVDDKRQWLKSRYGLRMPQTEKSIAFCQYTIMQDTIFEVKDALLDERFENTPLVTSSPNVRFYCGAPLINPEGFRLGTLCVIDFKPKELGLQQKLALETLAKNAATFFELQRQKKQLEEERKNVLYSEKKYRELIEHNQGFICTHDLKGRMLSINPVACQALQYAPEELIGKDLRYILAPRAKACFNDYLNKIARNKTFSGTMHVITKDGKEQYWAYRTIKFEDNSGEPYIIGSAMDVTERHLAEKILLKSKKELEGRVKERTAQLEQSNQDLRNINAELDTFLYRASHDLRGPLASFLGVCNVAMMEFADAKVQHYFQLISKKAAQTNQIITNLVEVSYIKSVQRSNTCINIHQLIHEITLELPTSHEVEIKVNSEDDINILSDETSLRIIFRHIIENAVLYRKSNIHPSYLHIRISENQDKNLVIVFADNGVGIPEHLHGKIFEMFYRGDERSKGSGLGLYLVKKAIERLNGSIQIFSKVGEGTTLEIVLPNQENNNPC